MAAENLVTAVETTTTEILEDRILRTNKSSKKNFVKNKHQQLYSAYKQAYQNN
jgi:hypothetical protein